ncbi:MAG: MOSC domain-containing protein [Lachnospiraceae bacterium]|nr:MOSC domain-containing protein [Lachnospiraceae bacterium]
MGEIKAINISRVRGTRKETVPQVTLIEGYGLEGDAHAGSWHRQVSLLSYEAFQDFEERGAGVVPGDFGENLLVSGFDFKNLPVGTRFRSGEVLLEMTQIGKECHAGCDIFKRMGDCIMPREGVFAVVLRGGVLREGDPFELVTD